MTNGYLAATLSSLARWSWLLLICFCVFIPQINTGYIINDDGQLVPFKIYKKGNHGSRLMCFLHPMNCRGGEMYKRKYRSGDGLDTEKRSILVDDIFEPSEKAEPNFENYKSILTLDSSIQWNKEQPVSRLKTTNSEKLARKHATYPFDDLVGEPSGSLQAIPDVDLSRELRGQFVKGAVADPANLEIPLAKAQLFEYPVYEIYAMNSDLDSSQNYIMSPKHFNSLTYQARQNRQ